MGLIVPATAPHHTAAAHHRHNEGSHELSKMRRVLHCTVHHDRDPHMPHGEPAGARCANLTDRNECILYGRKERPPFCLGWQPMMEVCGQAFEDAMSRISALERATA